MGARRSLSLLALRLAGCPFASQQLGISDACVPSGTSCPWLLGYREVIQLSAVEHSFRTFRAAACVCFRQSSCLPAGGKSGCLSARRQCDPSTALPVFRVVEFRVAVRLSGSLAQYRRQLSGYPTVRLPRRPGHLASRRLVGARHSVPLLREPAFATARKRSLLLRKLFLRRRTLRVVGSGRLPGHPGVRFEQTGEQLGGWLPGSVPIRVPDVRPRGECPVIRSPVALQSLVCCWQPGCLAGGGPALRYVGSWRPPTFLTGCRLTGSPVTRLSVFSSSSDSPR